MRNCQPWSSGENRTYADVYPNVAVLARVYLTLALRQYWWKGCFQLQRYTRTLVSRQLLRTDAINYALCTTITGSFPIAKIQKIGIFFAIFDRNRR